MQWSNLTFRPRNHVKFYVFEKNKGVRESQNSNSRNHKTEIFIDNVPFTLNPLVGLLPNSTTSKELTIWPRKCLQKRALKLVSWLPEVEDFLFLPQARKSLGLSASSAINRQDQASYSVRMHSVRAIVLPKLYGTLHNKISSLAIYIYKLVGSTLCKFHLWCKVQRHLAVESKSYI